MITWLRDLLLRSYVRLPEHPAKYRVVRWLSRVVFPESGIWATVHSGVSLRLHPRDWIEYVLLRGDQYEPRTLAFLDANLRPGDGVILAGVNFGLHVVVAARAVGETGRVIGVDPQPAALSRTRLNLEANNLLARVTLVHSALGSDRDLACMAWANVDNSGAANLFDQGNGLLVTVSPIREVVRAIGAPHLRLALVDVEGYEPYVLAGFGNDCRPDILVIECAPKLLDRANATASDLLLAMSHLGYTLYDVNGHDLPPDPADLVEHNVIGIRPGVRVIWPATDPSSQRQK